MDAPDPRLRTAAVFGIAAILMPWMGVGGVWVALNLPDTRTSGLLFDVSGALVLATLLFAVITFALAARARSMRVVVLGTLSLASLLLAGVAVMLVVRASIHDGLFT